ncbi:MAG: hypothetical protein QXS32_08855 [Candidatus Nezhaarchaeales archaeon]
MSLDKEILFKQYLLYIRDSPLPREDKLLVAQKLAEKLGVEMRDEHYLMVEG